MIRSVNSTYSAIRRVSRSAITAGPKGRTCVHTPILGTLRRSRTYRTTSHPIHINDLAHSRHQSSYRGGSTMVGCLQFLFCCWFSGGAHGLVPVPPAHGCMFSRILGSVPSSP